jgi:hypothetical protein
MVSILIVLPLLRLKIILTAYDGSISVGFVDEDNEYIHVGIWLPMRIVRAHVRGQRRPPRESLFADGVFTFVRSFARVRSSVSRKGTRIAERFGTPRILTAVWFLPSMYPHVHVQRRALSDVMYVSVCVQQYTETASEYLDERLSATFSDTYKRSFACVYAHVPQ